jgi:CheY-like chemotaxis protein
MASIRVLVVDDHTVVRRAVCSLLSTEQRHPLRGGCVSLKLVQSALWSGRYFDPSSSELESAAQPGSAAKAVFSMERLCPILSMAPALAIV